MIVYDFYTILSSAFDIGLVIKHKQSTKRPHRMKDLPLKGCIDFPAAEMQTGSLMTTATPRTTPCKIVFMYISHHFCNIFCFFQDAYVSDHETSVRLNI